MKAVLVIDMPNDADISKVRTGGDGNIYYMRDGEKASIVGNIRNIKPLPQKMTMEKALKMERVGAIKDIYTTWDACLAEITGETE